MKSSFCVVFSRICICSSMCSLLIASYGNCRRQYLLDLKVLVFQVINTSSHYLTIDNRKKLVEEQAVKDEIEAYKDELARDAANTTLAQVYTKLGITHICATIKTNGRTAMFGEDKIYRIRVN